LFQPSILRIDSYCGNSRANCDEIVRNFKERLNRIKSHWEPASDRLDVAYYRLSRQASLWYTTQNRNCIMSSPATNIESLQHEERVFPPQPEFAAKADIKSMHELEALRAEAAADPEKFWARFAESELHWFKKWETGFAVGSAACAVVHRRQNQYFVQLPGSPSGNCAAQQSRLDLGR
jgi:hypothetical protein